MDIRAKANGEHSFGNTSPPKATIQLEGPRILRFESLYDPGRTRDLQQVFVIRLERLQMLFQGLGLAAFCPDPLKIKENADKQKRTKNLLDTPVIYQIHSELSR